MKRILAILLAMFMALSCAAIAERSALPVTDYLAEQAHIDAFLMAEAEAGYSFEEPLVILNPYGSAPLSAVAIFTTEEEIGGTVTAKGKAAEDDISGAFPAAKLHFVPVYGLYNGGVTDVVLTLDDGRTTTVQVETEAIAMPSKGFTATMYNAELYDYSKLNISQMIRERSYIGYDSKGDIRWAITNTGFQGVVFLENGRMLIPTTFRYSSMNWWSNGLREIDGLGRVYNEYVYPGGTHHGFMQLPNGNYLAIADTPNDIDSEDYLTEIDPATGEVVWSLDLEEVLSRNDTGASAWDEHDWAHINAVDYDESRDLLIISARHQDAIVGVYKAEKKLAFILGDPSGWENEANKEFLLTPVGEGLEWQYGAHECTFLEDGSILLFDNGLGGRVKKPDSDKAIPDTENYSRAVIYKVDIENMTVEQVWQYGKELGAKYYSNSRSGVIATDEEKNAFFINFGICNTNWDGSLDSNAICTYIQQIENDELVWELAYTGLTYRAFRADPYAVAGNFDLSAQPAWHGSMADSIVLDKAYETENAAELSMNAEITDYPFEALRIAGTYVEPADAELADYAVILVDANGAQTAFDLHYYTSNAEDGTLITLDGWVSTTGLEPGAYDLYLVINGAVCDTGMVVDA